jgi:hypothetical protein
MAAMGSCENTGATICLGVYTPVAVELTACRTTEF